MPQEGPPSAPKTDLDRLIEYVGERFPVRDKEVQEIAARAAGLRLKGDVIELAFVSMDFRHELSSWVALARRLREERLADAMDTSHEERSSAARQQQIRRPNAKLVESRAHSDVAPLTEVVERLSSARDEMVSVLSWCQSLQRALRDDEYGEVATGRMEVPARLYSAPIGAALRGLGH